MKELKMKTLLLIPMQILEIIFIATLYFISFLNLKLASKLTDWCIKKLPDREWYFEKKNKNVF